MNIQALISLVVAVGPVYIGMPLAAPVPRPTPLSQATAGSALPIAGRHLDTGSGIIPGANDATADHAVATLDSLSLYALTANPKHRLIKHKPKDPPPQS